MLIGSESTATRERAEALRNEVGPGPVVMLDLLKFRAPDGKDRFAEYGALSGPLIARQGGEVFYLAECGPTLSGETWDLCVMVRFPDIEAFIGLVADLDYQSKAPALRDAALERTLWTVTQPPATA